VDTLYGEAKKNAQVMALRRHCDPSHGVSSSRWEGEMIRKLASGEYRLYSKKLDPRTGKRRNLGTFRTRAEAERHERAVQFFKRQG
jgi:hypothetical protein